MCRKKRRNLIIGVLILVNTCGFFTIQYTKKVEQEKIEIARIEAERLEEERLAEIARIEAERLEEERLAKIKEEIRLAKENAEKERINSIKYDSNNLLKVSNITLNEMTELLEYTHNGAAYNLVGLATAFIDAEATYGINAIFLIGLVAEESFWGRSDRAINTNNMTGMAVYNDNSEGTHYRSKYESVMDTARQLKENYLSEDGPYYNGRSIYDVNIYYCQGPNAQNWSRNINAISNKLSNEYKELF